MIDAITGVAELPRIDPGTFEPVYMWLYTQNLTSNNEGEDVPCTTTQSADLYHSGDKYYTLGLYKYAFDELTTAVENRNRVITTAIPHVSANITPKSPHNDPMNTTND